MEDNIKMDLGETVFGNVGELKWLRWDQTARFCGKSNELQCCI